MAWLIILACVVLSTLCDTIGTYFWETPAGIKRNSFIISIIVLSPLVFFCFGYAGSKFGLSIASSLTNSLIVLGPIIVGLWWREEWKTLTGLELTGMICIIIGIVILTFLGGKKA